MFGFICVLAWMAISGCLAGTILAYGKAKEDWDLRGEVVASICLCSLLLPLVGPAFVVYCMLGRGSDQ